MLEAFLLLVGFIWTTISDLIVLKALKIDSRKPLIFFIVYHSLAIILVSVSIFDSNIGLIVLSCFVSVLSYGISAFYPRVYIKKKYNKENNIPSFLEKHPVNFLYSLIALTTTAIITFAFYSFAQVAFCFETMSYLKGTTILRVVIFIILVIGFIFSLILFILGIICKRKESKKLRYIILYPFLELALVAILIFSFVPSSVSFYPNGRGRNLGESPNVSRITLNVDNKTYSAIYMNDNHEEITLLFVGNGMAAYEGYQSLSRYFEKSNSNVLIVDYPMFGCSNAYLSEKNIYEEADLFYNYIQNELGYTSDKIRIAGFSIGTGVANYTASKHEAKELVLAAPYYNFTSEMNTIVNVFYPPLSWTIQYKFPSDQYAKNVNYPVTIVSSEGDELIPHELSKKLSTCYPSEVTFIALKDKSHNATFASIEFQSKVLGVEKAKLDEK